MALILSIREGEDFYVGDTRYIVTDVKEPEVTINTGGVEFKLPCDCMLELKPEVMACSGKKHQNNVARIVIEADKSIKILRGELKRSESGN